MNEQHLAYLRAFYRFLATRKTMDAGKTCRHGGINVIGCRWCRMTAESLEKLSSALPRRPADLPTPIPDDLQRAAMETQ